MRPDGTVDPTRPKSTRLQKEKFPKSVDVYWQPKGYFDSATCMAYARRYQKQAQRGEKLHQLDNLGGQSDPEFRKFMKTKANTLLLFTVPGCTDVGAAVDAGLGRDVKGGMKRRFEADFEERMDDWCDGKITARMCNNFASSTFLVKSTQIHCTKLPLGG